MKIIRHMGIVAIGLFVILGLPYIILQPSFGSENELDGVTSASVILDQPSGDYVVFINKDRRKNEDTLNTWITFFSGGEISYVFEDIICYVADNDASGLQMAESLRSKLPENQMLVKTENGTLMMSKAEHGVFDIIVMSVEAAEMYDVTVLSGLPETQVCTLHNERGPEASFKGLSDEKPNYRRMPDEHMELCKESFRDLPDENIELRQGTFRGLPDEIIEWDQRTFRGLPDEIIEWDQRTFRGLPDEIMEWSQRSFMASPWVQGKKGLTASSWKRDGMDFPDWQGEKSNTILGVLVSEKGGEALSALLGEKSEVAYMGWVSLSSFREVVV